MAMKTISVEAATGTTLDYLVAKCVGGSVKCEHGVFLNQGDGYEYFTPSTDPAQGMPILDEAKISTLYRHGCWWATAGDPTDEDSTGLEGETRLVAGLRTWVWGQLGDTAEVPEELL